MTLTVLEQAYAKINLCLFLGPTRPDGRHELDVTFGRFHRWKKDV